MLGLAVAAALTGCASTQEPEVERVATAFEDTTGDAQARCELLAPNTLAALEENESEPCVEAIRSLPLEAGEVESVEVWGRNAQVRTTGDTLFLSQTDAGWRITAAACQPNGDAPYDCEVQAG
ncbi:MAG: hypothetical protein HOV79_07000 [Hamadaea sp.]|nr:hypothetical protein [Hamadaea sp.]